ncbi:MAG: radical SAM protein [Pseudonocardia sp.]
MHALIASPFLGEHLVVRPGHEQGIRISLRRYRALADDTRRNEPVPEWLADAAKRAWGMELTGASLADTVMVRPSSELEYARASWEINKGCDYDCEHCYLGLKRFEGLSWDGKMTLLEVMRDAGVLWLQITGGEPFIDAHFPASYEYASSLGMMIAISSNGSQLSRPRILECLTRHRPYRLTLSVYGATAETYEGLTRSRGAFGRFTRGLDAAREAGLPVRLNIIVADRNAHELDAMRALADHHGFPHQVYTNMSPTISGGGEPLPTQAADFLRRRRPFTGCNAGHTFFHSDPFGKASICKVGRDPQIDLIAEGTNGLRALGGIADGLMLRTGGCSGCTISGSCWTCRPLAKLYQEASAPLSSYCQHSEKR